MGRPELSPPCPGWQADLPGPTNVPNVNVSLGNEGPNYQDDVYLEVSRESMRRRGVLVLYSVFLICVTMEFASRPPNWSGDDLSWMFIWPVAILLMTWICTFMFKLDVSPPRDLPIRFNRARQRIYAYNFKYRWWNPFERWRVVPVAYDWAQVRAERWKMRGATPQGAIIFKWGVVLSIVKPGTNEVIDRFPLSTMGADEFAWAYICTYMQQGPSALPPAGPPRDHDDVPWYNLALRLAPKVKWPADMDRESRTAP
ncbi:DUF6708 domain-containing protein [Pseudomonas aeruginosa]